MRGGDTVAELSLNINVTGSETIDSDLNAELENIQTAVVRAMSDVGNLMMESLKKHIVTDVYKAYDPVRYERRSDDSTNGTPLNDLSAVNMTPIFDTDSAEKIGGTVGMDYHPTGEHQNYRWHGADDDDLIRRIETGLGYDYMRTRSKTNEYGEVVSEEIIPYPERRFWQKFVDEMTDGGAMERAIFWKMAENGYTLDMKDGVIRDANDGNY